MRTPTLVLIALMLAAPATAQEGSEGAETFVREVYALYNADEGPWPIDDRVLDRIWTPEMATLIRRDRELSGDELPYLDADPVCGCQDAGDVVVERVALARASGGRLATVRFTNFGETATTVLRLSGGPGRWRISDVVNQDGYPGLAEALADSNRRIEAGGRALGRD
jgi:hypothetical protein